MLFKIILQPFIYFLYMGFLLLVNTKVSFGSFPDIYHNLSQNGNMSSMSQSIKKVIKYMYSEEKCLQLFTDDSIFSKNVVKDIYMLPLILSILNNPFKKINECKNSIIIGEDFLNINKTLKMRPLWYGFKILCIYYGKIKYSGWIPQHEDGEMFFHDAEGILMFIDEDQSNLYTRLQPSTELQKINAISGVWKKMNYHTNNFLSRTLEVATFNCNVFSYIGNPDTDGSTSHYYGAEADIISELSKRLNLTLKFMVPSETNKWGRFVNGAVDGGVLKMIWEGTADIASCGLWMELSMIETGMEMSVPLGDECLKFLVPRPEPITTGWKNIFKPFEIEVWLSILVYYFIATFLLFIFSNVSSHWNCQHRGVARIGRCFFEVFSIFLNNSIYDAVGAVRILIFTFVVLSFLLNTCFSSGLFSQLTMPIYSDKMDSMEALVRNDYYWTTSSFPDSTLIFNLENPIEQCMCDRYVPSNDFSDVLDMHEKGVKLALVGHHLETGINLDEDYPNSFMTKFEVSSVCLRQKFYAFGHRKGSPFVKPMDTFIRRLQSAGLVSKMVIDMLNRLAPKEPYIFELMVLEKSKISSANVLSFRNIVGVFNLYITGLILSLLAFIFERIITYIDKQIAK